jgi:hypothetical protein
MANYKDIKNEYDIIWDSSIQSTNFTAESTQGYFIDTSSAVVTMTLPASPGAGDFVAVKDYARSFGTNKLAIDGNGSNIQGNASLSELDQTGDTAVLVYIDSTKGWLYTQENTVTPVSNAEFIAATGGTITTSGDFKIHTFTSSGTFTVTSAGNACGSNSVSYMVVAGGGAGGGSIGGGGGAGGFREGKATYDTYTASPLDAGSGLPVSVQGYPVTIGGGGAGEPGTNGKPAAAPSGVNSVFSTITSAGGGGGGNLDTSDPLTAFNGRDGGSGGGSTIAVTPVSNGGGTGGSGNTPSVSPPQGFDGASRSSYGPYNGTGGGGATATGSGGSPTTPSPSLKIRGGNGATTSITGTPTTYAGGGGGGAHAASTATGGNGGTGGGGPGGNAPQPDDDGTAGTANTGGGGGGGGHDSAGHYGASGGGGSGIVIIRYKFQ